MKPRILDLCGGTGAWSQPYADAGYLVDVIEITNQQDVRLLCYDASPIHGILAAPPCTVFSYARNRYPPSYAELKQALSVVDACLRIIHAHQPRWWALENPRNKLRRYLGPPQWEFYQWEYGDPAHKPTCLWGRFNSPPKCPGVRQKPSTWKTKKENASPKDAITPPNFAKVFFEANP